MIIGGGIGGTEKVVVFGPEHNSTMPTVNYACQEKKEGYSKKSLRLERK
jgi:hypothetical protein